MDTVWTFLTRRRGRNGPDVTDILSYAYLAMGFLLIFGPIVWLGLSSFKTQAELLRYPPSLLPQQVEMVAIPGQPQPLPLYTLTKPDGTTAQVGLRRIVGKAAVVVDVATGEKMDVPREAITAVSTVKWATENYTVPLTEQGGIFNFPRYLFNSTFVTVVGTLITVAINAMAAFALSKYRFPGRTVAMMFVVGALMVPPTVILVPLFLVVREVGMFNSLWGVIIPGAATPTGVFLLRQYMLTIPDELIEAARMDNAGEWKIFWRIVLPLSLPAIAVLTILSVIWRWNDFLWPLIILQDSSNYTLQVALSAFQGQFETQWNYLLAMTVLTLLPVTAVFAVLQKYVTTGIANTGIK